MVQIFRPRLERLVIVVLGVTYARGQIFLRHLAEHIERRSERLVQLEAPCSGRVTHRSRIGLRADQEDGYCTSRSARYDK